MYWTERKSWNADSLLSWKKKNQDYYCSFSRKMICMWFGGHDISAATSVSAGVGHFSLIFLSSASVPWCDLQVVDANCLAAAVALVWAGVGVTVWWKGHRAKLSNQLSSAWFIHDNTLTEVAKVNKVAQVPLTAVPLHIWTQKVFTVLSVLLPAYF